MEHELSYRNSKTNFKSLKDKETFWNKINGNYKI